MNIVVYKQQQIKKNLTISWLESVLVRGRENVALIDQKSDSFVNNRAVHTGHVILDFKSFETSRSVTAIFVQNGNNWALHFVKARHRRVGILVKHLTRIHHVGCVGVALWMSNMVILSLLKNQRIVKNLQEVSADFIWISDGLNIESNDERLPIIISSLANNSNIRSFHYRWRGNVNLSS